MRFRFVVADDFHLCGFGDVGCWVALQHPPVLKNVCVSLFVGGVFGVWLFDVLWWISFLTFLFSTQLYAWPMAVLWIGWLLYICFITIFILQLGSWSHEKFSNSWNLWNEMMISETANVGFIWHGLACELMKSNHQTRKQRVIYGMGWWDQISQPPWSVQGFRVEIYSHKYARMVVNSSHTSMPCFGCFFFFEGGVKRLKWSGKWDPNVLRKILQVYRLFLDCSLAL